MFVKHVGYREGVPDRVDNIDDKSLHEVAIAKHFRRNNVVYGLAHERDKDNEKLAFD